jgi:hypothetical protein
LQPIAQSRVLIPLGRYGGGAGELRPAFFEVGLEFTFGVSHVAATGGHKLLSGSSGGCVRHAGRPKTLGLELRAVELLGLQLGRPVNQRSVKLAAELE